MERSWCAAAPVRYLCHAAIDTCHHMRLPMISARELQKQLALLLMLPDQRHPCWTIDVSMQGA